MKLFTTILFILLFISVHGQIEMSKDFSYTVSSPYKVVDGRKNYFSKNGEVLSVKYGRGKFTFQKFSGNKLNEVKREVVEKGEGFSTEEYLEFNNRFYFFFSRWDRENTTEQLFVREIDFDNCNWAGEEKLLIQVDGKITTSFKGFEGISGYGANVLSQLSLIGKATTQKFHFEKSYSENRIVIQYRRNPEERNDALNNDVIGMHVFDGDMNEVWDKDIVMPYTEKKMNNLSYSIDEKGNTYVLAEVYLNNTRRRAIKGVVNYRLELIKINHEDQSVSNYEVILDDKFITDVNFFEGANREIIIAGYYGNRFGKGTDGCFIFKLNNDGEIKEKQHFEVPVEVMSKYMSDIAQRRMAKKDDRKDVSMPNMLLREITFHPNGSITLYGEKYYVKETYNPQTRQTTRTYYYQEVLGSHINKEGKLEWMNKFPKNQRGKAQRGGMGYYLISQENYDYILFLDNVRNIELPINKYPKTHVDGQGGFLTGFKIETQTGEAEKISIFDTRDAKGIKLYQFNTGRIIAIGDGQFAVECYKKKKEDIMLKVKLEN